MLTVLKEHKNVSVTVLDLYKDNFNPVLPPEEHYTYQRSPVLSDIVKKYQNIVYQADKLIFIYPVWWFSMPAMMKGFFDRVFTSPFAFKYEPRKVLWKKVFFPDGKLKGKKAIILNTTGSPKIFDMLMLRIPSHVVSFGIIRFCGIKNRVYTSYNCLKCDEKKALDLKRRARKAIRWLLK